MSNDVTYTDDLTLDFPDAEEVRNETTPKEVIYRNKKRTFLASLGSDILNRARTQGIFDHSATLTANFLGLTSEDQEQMINEVIAVVQNNGFKIEVTKNEDGSRLVKVDWSKTDVPN